MTITSRFAVACAAAILCTAGLVSADTAHAQSAETFSDPAIANGLSTVAPSALRDARDCLEANGTSRAVRACTKTLRVAAPVSDLKASLYARRGISQLSLGRFERASQDFRRAARLDGDNMLAALGDGFAAMMREDHDRALSRFAECAESEAIAALSAYGTGLSQQMQGDADAARAAYRTALNLRPGWDAVEEQLATL